MPITETDVDLTVTSGREGSIDTDGLRIVDVAIYLSSVAFPRHPRRKPGSLHHPREAPHIFGFDLGNRVSVGHVICRVIKGVVIVQRRTCIGPRAQWPRSAVGKEQHL